jgi:hypothetical protein
VIKDRRMNILKAFKEEKYMDMAFDNFVQFSGRHREISLSRAIVTTKDYDQIYFRTIDEIEKAHWLGGICFQKLDTMGYNVLCSEKDEDIIAYLQSRIRG